MANHMVIMRRMRMELNIGLAALGPCRECGKPARGAQRCLDCLKDDLRSEIQDGDPNELINRYVDAVRELDDSVRAINRACRSEELDA